MMYLLFGWTRGGAMGGMRDLLGVFATVAEAERFWTHEDGGTQPIGRFLSDRAEIWKIEAFGVAEIAVVREWIPAVAGWRDPAVLARYTAHKLPILR